MFLPPKAELMPSLEQVLYSGQISEGAPVKEFEDGLADWLGATNVLSFYSGTAALHEALILAGVGPGDEVISTPMTAEPTNMAIAHSGAKIVWGDVDPRNGNLDPESVRSKITSKTKAVMAVHYGGVPVDLTRMRQVVEEAGIPLIEDGAHALGASYGGKRIGTHSEFVMFSFQAIKHITTVDGGLLTVSDPELMERGRQVRWFGIDREASRTEVSVDTVGYKYHMNNVNATIGLAQLPHFDFVVNAHIHNGKFLDAAIDQMGEVDRVTWDDQADPSYWFYTILVDSPGEVQKKLMERGIAASKLHRRNDQHPVFAESACELPQLDEFWNRMLHIPCGWWLTENDRDRIVHALKSC